ncbi:MAG: chitin disaccharide deacetylase [Symbiobacteriia bacterium]
MTRQLIVNADDFGLSPGVSLGILAAHKEGIVTSTTLMVNMPGAQDAFELAKTTPTLGVGIHFTLDAGKPVAAGVDSLTGPDGKFLKLPALKESARPDHIKRELAAQFEAFLASGLTPTHIDSHHHVCGHLHAAEEAMLAIAAEYRVPARHFGFQRERFERHGVETTDHFTPCFYGKESITVDHLLQIILGLEPGVTELMCHPAYLDHHLLKGSSYAAERVAELATLTEPQAKALLQSLGVQLISYRELQN